MGDTDDRVFHVDQCGHISIQDPSLAGCSMQDLMLAQIASLQELLDLLPPEPQHYALRAALSSLMANIHSTVMHGCVTLASFEDHSRLASFLKTRCNVHLLASGS